MAGNKWKRKPDILSHNKLKKKDEHTISNILFGTTFVYRQQYDITTRSKPNQDRILIKFFIKAM